MRNYLSFSYVNWREDLHDYVILPESGSLQYDRTKGWMISGEIVTRDCDTRPDMGPARRRTFMLTGMRNVRAVNAA